MLTTKTVLKSTMGIALTASLFVLAGCPEQAAVTTPSGTPVASSTATVAPTVAPTAVATVAPVVTPVASSTATVAPTTAPVTTDITTQQGTTPDINSKATLDGRVTDETGSLLDGVTIVAEAVGISGTANAWKQSTATVRGSYVFRDVPVGVVLKVNATKSGFTSREQSIVLKSNLQGNANQNKLNFDTTDSGSTGYFLQDAPEITKLVINGVEATDAGTLRVFGLSDLGGSELDGATANVTGLKNDQLKMELTFSEPVQQSEVKNFEIDSQSFSVLDNQPAPTIDGNTDGVTYDWNSDNTQVVISLAKPLLVNSSGDEAIYRFSYGSNTLFKDAAGKSALKSKYIRFNSNTANNYVLFSLQNDSDSPNLVGISARDGSTDVLELTFSEKLSVQGRSSQEARLANPFASSNGELSAWYGNVEDDATYLGFEGDGDGAYTYAVAKINETDGGYLESLFGNADSYNGEGYWHMSDLSTGPIRKASFVDGNSAKVRIELDPSAFSAGDLIILSVGQDINTTYSNKSLKSNVSLGYDIPAPIILSDPAGNAIDRGNGQTNSNVRVNNGQRAARAS